MTCALSRRRRTPATLIAALALLLLRSSLAGAVTFGADLAAPPDNPAPCSALGTGSCTFFSGAPGPSFYAPFSGTVTAVRVRTGAFQQGPMQILVMRSLYQNNLADPGHPYFACCFVEAYGPVFTPDPGSITTVPTSLRMVEDPIPPPNDGIDNARGDFLALSVLAPNVPIPATSDNLVFTATGGSLFSGYAPAPDPQNTPAPSPNPLFASSGGFGYHMSMNADLQVGGGGNDALPVTIATGGQLLGTTAVIPLTCALAGNCKGVLRLNGLPAAAQVAAVGIQLVPAVRTGKTYGKHPFKIRSGATLAVQVRLNAAGRRLVGDLANVVVLATARVHGKSVQTAVTLAR